MLLTLMLASRVEAAQVACEPLHVIDTRPGYSAQAVPPDAPLTMILWSNCEGSTNWTLSVEDESGAVLAAAPWTWDGGEWALAVLTPPTRLPSNATLTVQATPDGGSTNDSPAWSNSFTTGDADLQGMTGLPTATMDSAIWYQDGGNALTWTDLSPAPDPDGLSYFVIDGIGSPSQYLVADHPLDDVPFMLQPGVDEPTELCVDVQQVDGTGTPSDLVTTCMTDFDRSFSAPPGLCSTGPGKGSFAGALLVALALSSRVLDVRRVRKEP